MRKSTRILALVWVLVLLAPLAYAGHALNSPVATTNPGDFWCSGDADFDGTVVFDGVPTFNANAIFTLDVSVGDDLTVTDDISCDSLYVGTNIAVTDDLTVGDDLNGARVWLNMAVASSNLTGDSGFGGIRNSGLTSTEGVPVTRTGSVVGYAVRYNIDSFSAGAYAVTRFYIDGVKTFADSLYVTGTGMQERPGTFARGTYTFAAGEQLYAEFDIEGTIQYDRPYLTWDLQLDD